MRIKQLVLSLLLIASIPSVASADNSFGNSAFNVVRVVVLGVPAVIAGSVGGRLWYFGANALIGPGAITTGTTAAATIVSGAAGYVVTALGILGAIANKVMT